MPDSSEQDQPEADVDPDSGSTPDTEAEPSPEQDGTDEPTPELESGEEEPEPPEEASDTAETDNLPEVADDSSPEADQPNGPGAEPGGIPVDGATDGEPETHEDPEQEGEIPLKQNVEWTVPISELKPDSNWEEEGVDTTGLTLPGDPPQTPEGEVDWGAYDAPGKFAADNLKVAEAVAVAKAHSGELGQVIEDRTIETLDDVDNDEFFTSADGGDTVVTMYDFEKEVQNHMKEELVEVDRYWVNKPYSFVSLLESKDDNEVKYYAVEPYLTEVEEEFLDYLSGKIQEAVTRGGLEDTGRERETLDERRETIEEKTYELLEKFELYSADEGLLFSVYKQLMDTVPGLDAPEDDEADTERLEVSMRPEEARIEDQEDSLNLHQVEKILYYLKRDFVGYERIDPIKHDISVEDISCNGYHRRVFAYHGEHEQIITNIEHGEQELDDFVIKLAQRSGKGISKRSPQVDATLPDGSRAQLTLGDEVSDHGTNYTIRQFKDVPFTPVDLINWKTFSLDQMAFLWLCIENHKSLIFAGGTASGKTTSLNAVSLFIPSGAKVVSIEDTREVELPQRNWIASVTRPSFSAGDKGDVDEFDLLEAALRQRPDYIVMGEIRGEEGRTAFQVMSTGHTTYTTFHADSVGEVLKRFTTEPINVSKTMFTALDLVSIQVQTRSRGRKVRRSKTITEINHYDAENDEINIRDVYQWDAEEDVFNQMGEPNTLEEIAFDRGWGMDRLDRAIEKRKSVLAYLIANGHNTYKEVAATVQAFIADPDSIMALIAQDKLAGELDNLQKMESVLIDVSDEDEEMVPRPDPDEDIQKVVSEALAENRGLINEYADAEAASLVQLLSGMDKADSIDPAAIERRTELRELSDEESLPDDPHQQDDVGQRDDQEDTDDTAADSDADTSAQTGEKDSASDEGTDEIIVDNPLKNSSEDRDQPELVGDRDTDPDSDVESPAESSTASDGDQGSDEEDATTEDQGDSLEESDDQFQAKITTEPPDSENTDEQDDESEADD